MPPDLHVSEMHSHARQCLPACLPAARRRPAPGQGFGVRCSRRRRPEQGSRGAGERAPRRASHLTQPAPRCRRD